MTRTSSSQGQSTISSYFSNTPAKSSTSLKTAGKRRAAVNFVDLTSDETQSVERLEPVAKKRKKSSKLTASQDEDIVFEPDLSNPLHEGHNFSSAGPSRLQTPPPQPSRNSRNSVEKYRFIGSPVAQGSTDPQPETPEEKRAKKARREDFKRRLLEDNSSFSKRSARRSPDTLPVLDVRDNDKSDGVRLESDLEGDDVENTLLPKSISSKRFPFGAKTHNAKGAVSSGKMKEKEETGPSGLPYTPLERQILALQKKYPDTILMVEVGYKYRFYGEDARIASKHLNIVAFTDRNFLTAGIPVHRRDIHLKKLLSQGYKVGVIGQMETAALKKISDNRNAPFERDLTHLYTAATYIEELDSADDPSTTNPGMAPNLVCIVENLEGGMGADERVSLGIVSVTPSTGDVIWDDFEDGFMRTELETRMAHIRPAELLLPVERLSKATEKLLRYFTDDRPSTSADKERVRVERISKTFSFSEAYQELQNFYAKGAAGGSSENFQTGKLLASLSDLPKRVVIGLASSILYLKAFGLADVLTRTEFFAKFTERQHMLLNANTLANLEIYRNQTDYTARGSLMWALDKTKTKFGARLFRNWLGRPLVDIKALQARVDAIEEILDMKSVRSRELIMRLSEVLKGLPDLAKGLSRVQYGKCQPKEFASLVKAFSKIAAAFEVYQSPEDVGFRSELLNDVIYALPRLKESVRSILSVFNLSKALEDKRDELWYDEEKYPSIADARCAIDMIESELQDHLKQIRKILHKPAAQYTSVAGEEYLIEIKKDEKREIPVTWKIVSSTKTLRRYQTPEVQKKIQERAQFQEKLEAEANSAYLNFLEQIVDDHYIPLRNVVNKLAIADCLLSLSTVASQADYVKPTFIDDDILDIRDGRHPMIEVLRTDPFVPNDLCLGGGHARTKIITGPNMGGKSSAVRMVALVVLMAQIGSYVPASSVRMGLVDAILTRMGAFDDISSGRSTFMIEMSETSDILHSATNRSLVILDELGRGTSTFDGMAIASAVLEHLISAKRSKTLFITHYPLVATAASKKFPEDVCNVHMGFTEETEPSGKRFITFLYRIVEGLSSGSYGIECARLAGLPEELLEAAAGRANVIQATVESRGRKRSAQKAFQILHGLITHKSNKTDQIEDLKAKLHIMCQYME